MPFRSLFQTETAEQETARLAAFPTDSREHFWSTLPVRNEYISIDGVYRLPADHAGGPRVTVAVLSYVPGKLHGFSEVRLHDDRFTAVVLGDNRPDTVTVEEAALSRAEKIDLTDDPVDNTATEINTTQSRNDYWKSLPVRQTEIVLHSVYRLPANRFHKDHVTVVVLENTSSSENHTFFDVTVIGGNSTTYRPGGYHLSVSDTELFRAEKIDL